MPFLYFLQELRNPVLDAIFSVITLCGEETVFMAVGMIVFWCISKYQGYYLLSVGFVGTLLNQFLKMLFRIPRPWVRDPNFPIVESAREAASGYSFPSGHTQTSVGLFGGLALWNKQRWLRIAMIALCVLVPLSRMYLGVHTPADVLVSIGIALIMIFVGAPLFRKAEHSPKLMYTIIFTLVGLMLAYLAFICLYEFPASAYLPENIHNLESAQKNGFTLTGCVFGLIFVYTVDLKWTKFDTRAVWWAQILKAVGGIGLVLAVKELMRFPLDAILPADSWARLVRYFLMVIVGGVLWPMTFRYFAKLGKKDAEKSEVTK
ncbi:MAG: phosphatase PAP2 family protein [Clostridia bacterium]|nr:phosphatase PAP2 family protein [Clostridia bacterium]